MSDAYSTLEKKIAGLPESCLDEVSEFVDFINFRAGIGRQENNRSAVIDDDARTKAINEAFGLWADHDNSLSVDETVRQMRRGRRWNWLMH